VNAVRAAVVTAGALVVAFLAAGCAAGNAAPPPGRVPPGSVSACTAFGVRAIDQHLTVTRLPPACQGLSKAQVNQAIGRAIYLVAGPRRHKVAWRHLASLAGARLAGLISAPQDTVGPRPRGYAISGSGPPGRRGSDTALGFSALAVWILAAGSGSYILVGWISHGGLRRLRAGGAGLSPAVIFGHAALPAVGLLVWIIYLATGWAALAWAAVGLLLPVAGLGMAMLTIGLSGERADVAAAAGPRTIQARPAQRSLSLLAVLGHGLLAVGTVLLVLLAALGASGN
jgi:hypothetical protein